MIRELMSPLTGEAQRLLHGRGKKWPGLEHLCIDYFPPHILVTTYKEITDQEVADMLSELRDFPNILFQKRYLKNSVIEVLKGEFSTPAYAVEKSEKYLLNLGTEQNIGFFLDMAPGREWLRKNSDKKRVLNLFAYTCSLSVSALKGGADYVLNMDMSQRALKTGEKNHALNELDLRKVQFLPHDIMKSFGALVRKGPFEIVIIDPPTNQGESFEVKRDYAKIIRRLNEFTRPGSIVMACLNSPFLGSDFLISLFEQYAPGYILVEKMYSGFSESEVDPESGLKILFFKR